MSSLTGRVLGAGYRVGALLGEGGMGAVYEAVHEPLGRLVALKVLHRAELTAAALSRFEREARAAAALHHPGIVQVTDFQANPGEPPFLVMERLVGESLRARIRREGRVDPGQLCFIASQVLDALAAAHRAGIIHRDIKPDNVHLTNVGSGVVVVKLLDFGIAKLKHEAPMTQAGAMVGSPAYMSPEQALGQAVDARTDVYGVGALMYHALSGRLPIDDRGSMADVLTAIVERQVAPLHPLVPGVAPELAALVARAMSKDREPRFASAEAMLQALQPFIRVSAPTAAPLASSIGAPLAAAPLAYSIAGAPQLTSAPRLASPGGPPGGPPPGPPPGGPPPYAAAAPFMAASLPGTWPAAPTPPASLPRSGAAPRRSLAALGVGVGVLSLGLVLAVALVVIFAQRSVGPEPSAALVPDGAPRTPAATSHAPAASSEPSASCSASSAPKPGSPSSPTPGPSPSPSSSAPRAADAGRPSGVIDPPPAGAKSVSYTGFDLSPYNDATKATEVVRNALGSFRGCAPLACVGRDPIREDVRILDASYFLTLDAAGRVASLRSRTEVRNAVVACPAFDACMAPKVRAVPFPAPQSAARDVKLYLLFKE